MSCGFHGAGRPAAAVRSIAPEDAKGQSCEWSLTARAAGERSRVAPRHRGPRGAHRELHPDPPRAAAVIAGREALRRRSGLAAKDAWRKKWVVHVDPPQGRDPAALTKYLARYVRGVAVSDRRIVHIGEDSVTLGTRRGLVRMNGREFVRRFAQHILPRRFHAVRYWGLYAPSQTLTRLVQAWRLLHARDPDLVDPHPPRFERAPPVCPKCAGPVVEPALEGVPYARPRGVPRPRGPP